MLQRNDHGAGHAKILTMWWVLEALVLEKLLNHSPLGAVAVVLNHTMCHKRKILCGSFTDVIHCYSLSLGVLWNVISTKLATQNQQFVIIKINTVNFRKVCWFVLKTIYFFTIVLLHWNTRRTFLLYPRLTQIRVWISKYIHWFMKM